MQFIKMVVWTSVLLLMGCKQSFTHDYLLQHPKILNEEVSRCETSEKDNDAYCAMVRQTHQEFASLISVCEQNPEHFGLQILQTQQELVRLAKQAKTGDEQAKKNYQEQLKKVKILLAVVSVTGMVE